MIARNSETTFELTFGALIHKVRQLLECRVGVAESAMSK